MFTLYLPCAVFSFEVELSSFALASKARIILYYSHLCTNLMKKTNVNLTFAVCCKRNSQSLHCLLWTLKNWFMFCETSRKYRYKWQPFNAVGSIWDGWALLELTDALDPFEPKDLVF